MRRVLTDVFLRTVKPPARGRERISDARVANLIWQITSTGDTSWYARARRPDGKRPSPKIGDWPSMGISEARRRAQAEIAAIQAGGDPVAARRAAKAARAARASLPTVTERLIEWQEARAGVWADGYAAAVKRMCDREIVPQLGNRPLVETTREDWTTLVTRKRRQSESSGANLYRTSSAFLNHAEAAGWIGLALLPRKGASLLAPAVDARARVLTDDELRAIWWAAEDMTPKSRAYVHLLMMTAARRREVADIATGELDLDLGLWSIPGTRTKNHVGITVPLHPTVVTELRTVWPAHGEAAGPHWRLLGDIAGSGLSGFSKIKARLDEKAGIAEWHMHDLRRTARTGMARLGVAREHAEAALNHLSARGPLERVYNVHDYRSEIIAALTRWQLHVAGLVSTPPIADVIPMRRKRAARAVPAPVG